jgi:phosphoglycolate phosphatase-like HAD superfamily hydrolase
MRYRHIVFDIDGTMLDTGRADMLATQETFFLTSSLKKHLFYN